MSASSDSKHLDAQAQKDKARLRVRRENEKALEQPGVRAFEKLVRDLYDPQTGVSLKRQGKDRKWQDLGRDGIPKGFPTPRLLRRHVELKESIAVTWGPRARIRTLDADAHGEGSPLDALPTLWDAIRAIHLGRDGTVLPPLKDGAIPDGVKLAGAIVTSPNGLHYIERTGAPWQGDTLKQDCARVTACLRDQCVQVCPGVIEVLPGPNGQARLPLGYGCTFVYPALGAVDVETGLAILEQLKPVSRTFDALGEGHRREDFDRQREDEHEPTWLEQFGAAEQFECHDVTERPKYRSRWRKPNRNQLGDTLYEGRGVSLKGRGRPTKSHFVESMERVVREGASEGRRNRQLWDLCILHRLIWGGSREEVETRISAWFEEAPHTSKDLANLSQTKRKAARRTLRKHLDKIDQGLASGRFYQLGARKSDSHRRDPLLLVPGTDQEASELVALGEDFLAGVKSVDGLPLWLQSALRRVVGGVVKWTRAGRIVLPASMLEWYAGTKQSRKCPFSGQIRPSYQILLEALQRVGVIGGMLSMGDRGKKLASVYESNVGREVQPAITVAKWPKGNGRKQAPWKRAPYEAKRLRRDDQAVGVGSGVSLEASEVGKVETEPWSGDGLQKFFDGSVLVPSSNVPMASAPIRAFADRDRRNE